MQEIHGGDIYRNHVHMDFSINVNPLGMPEDLKAALHRAVEKCLEYPDIHASKLTWEVGRSLEIPNDHLLFGNGASELLMGIVHALMPKRILLPVPSFYGYEYVSQAVGGEIFPFFLKEEDSFLFRDDFFDFLTEDMDVLFLANPNNPTGKKLDKEYLLRVFDVCREKGVYVVLDECFADFCRMDVSMITKVKEYDNLLILRAFTKIFAIPGVRLGYLVCGNRSLLKKISCQLPEWNVSSFAQEAGIICARQTEYLKKTAEYMKVERQFLADGLKKFGIHFFSGEANFLLLKTDLLLYERLLQKGILIRDCKNFRGLSEGYYRIAVKNRQENESLLKAIGECIE